MASKSSMATHSKLKACQQIVANLECKQIIIQDTLYCTYLAKYIYLYMYMYFPATQYTQYSLCVTIRVYVRV